MNVVSIDTIGVSIAEIKGREYTCRRTEKRLIVDNIHTITVAYHLLSPNTNALYLN
jgi:hypothetical protein